jgi:hypothetical protein
MRAIGKGCLALLLWITVASAQTAGPTDNDLLASYCLGVSQAKAEDARRLSQSASECRHGWGTSEAMCRQMLDTLSTESEAMRQRFTRYLVARGYLTNRDMIAALPGLAAMRMGGQQDLQTCDDATPACFPQCASDRTGTCLLRCRARISACAKTDRCFRADVLPF